LPDGIIVGVKVDLMSNPDPEPGSALLGIGELAGLTGKRPSAIRYYEQIGLLPQPARVDGRRRYLHGIVRTLAVIDTAQRAGLALDEIKTLLAASPADGEAIGRLRQVAERKLPQIIALIERSQLVRDWLECAARCECPDLDQCPLFDDPAIPAPRQRSQPSPRPAPTPAELF
jgi:MerR family redox-sensitive transcriptional activator SoxR